MKSTMKKLLAVVLTIAMLATFAACGGNTAKNTEYVIGFSGPLTGPAAVYGQAVKNAAQMAVDEINAAGGLDGVNFKLEAMDDKHDATKVAANFTTLMEGEGSIKDITIASCYAIAPLGLLMIPATIASNFVLVEEADIVSLVITFGLIWAGLLIFFGMMVTHDYSLGRNFITTIGTIIGMAFIIFIAVLFTTLLGKLVSFVTNIVTELQYRM